MNQEQQVSPDDWRLQGQEKYLKGVTLILRDYYLYHPDWDHDHCAFCWAKFSLYDGDLKRGYSTEDGYHWICEKCFNDFQHIFNWSVGNVSDV